MRHNVTCEAWGFIPIVAGVWRDARMRHFAAGDFPPRPWVLRAGASGTQTLPKGPQPKPNHAAKRLGITLYTQVLL